jgi:uncharacterized integral membrane protein (TIGR00698 family)
MTATAAREVPKAQEPRRALHRLPGLLAAATIAFAATVVGHRFPIIGAPVIAVALGAVLSGVVRRRAVFSPGVRVASKPVLQLAVVLLGAQLSLGAVLDVGRGSLPVMLGTLAVCLTMAFVVGRRLGIDSELQILIGVGTAICGASAIAAVSPTIRARSENVAYAITTIFLFNIAAVLVFPPLGHLLGMSQHAFGLFAGTAVNDTSSVVAAASSYGTEASQYAVVVKLTRTLMIIPICIILGALVARRSSRGEGTADGHAPRSVLRLVPWFLIWFLVLAGANSLGLVPSAAHAAIQWIAVALITTALAGIGMTTDIRALRRTGARPVVFGFILWLSVSVTSLCLQAL